MTPQAAIKAMLYLVTALLLFHFCILLKIIPYTITWGGRLKNDTEMYAFETISILINLLLFSVLLIKGNYIRAYIGMKAVNIALWIFFVLFGLNTIGNILAKTYLEKFFTVLTLAFSVLIWIILRKSKKQTTTH